MKSMVNRIGKRGALCCGPSGIGALLMALCLAVSVPALAKPSKKPSKPPVKISALDDLEFGVIAPHHAKSGKVVVRPNRNNNSKCNSNLTCFEGGDRARFRLKGQRNSYVTVDLPQSIQLINGAGDTMKVNRFKMKANGFTNGQGYIGKNEKVTLGVGATLNVKAGQPPGAYTGTFEINLSFQ